MEEFIILLPDRCDDLQADDGSTFTENLLALEELPMILDILSAIFCDRRLTELWQLEPIDAAILLTEDRLVDPAEPMTKSGLCLLCNDSVPCL